MERALELTKEPGNLSYLPVRAEGRFHHKRERYLYSISLDGEPGWHVITPLQTVDGHFVLVDRGFVPQEDRYVERGPTRLTIRGNLHWPDEKGGSTPDPNLSENIWFARDVPAMASQLDTLPILVVASVVEGDAQGVEPIPVSIQGIPNNHLSYAVQWFMIAAVWAGMTLALIWRIRQRRY